MHKRLMSDSGVVLIVCLAVLFMLSLIGIASITTSNTDMDIADNEYKATGAFYAAESGLERAAAALIISYRTIGAAPNPLPGDTVSELSYVYCFRTADDGPAITAQLTEGSYRGLSGLIKTFTINSLGINTSSNAGVELQLQIKDALIPLFQFAVFYEYDLEIAPGADMTLGGRVHTNHDMYLQADRNLYINSYLTAAGSIYHGRKPGSGQSETNRDVWITDDGGIYQTMRNTDATFLDATAADWVNESISRWGGMVEDGNHGISQLYMPVVIDGPPTDLIDRADGGNNPDSYENKAGLKFIDGQAYYRQLDGTWINVTSNLISQNVISDGNFNDGREGQDVYSLDIDISRLNSSGYFPSNGIIYASGIASESYVRAVRLINGSELAGPLTVASDNPLYTVGNYNVVNKQPASLITDALTILSGSWDDSRSSGNANSRTASDTQINACYMTGNTETGSPGHNYCGGFENLPRFLEKWTSKTLTWRGAAVDLWYSRQATGAWDGSYYEPPIRDWAFDPDLLDPSNMPPGTPMVNIVQRMNWSQKVHNVPDGAFSEVTQ